MSNKIIEKYKKPLIIITPIATLFLVIVLMRVFSGGERPKHQPPVLGPVEPKIFECYSFQDTIPEIKKLIETLFSSSNSDQKAGVLECLSPLISPNSRIIIEKETGNDYSTLALYSQNPTAQSLEIIGFKNLENSLQDFPREIRVVTKPSNGTPKVALSSPNEGNEEVPSGGSVPPSNNTGDANLSGIKLSTLYQGKLGGRVRRLELRDISYSKDKIQFIYSVIGSVQEDRNQPGTVWVDGGKVEFESLGQGQFSTDKQKTSFSFNNGEDIFHSIN